jgi:NAD(P)-dependent dehydrogenase (short-subunit alcohol dehydrogenase family)
MLKHQGKVAVCAGGATGIGAQSMRRLAQGGAKVVIGDINMEGAERVVAEITAAGGEGLAVQCDISSEAAVGALVEAAIERFGGVDLAHINAADVSLTRGGLDNDLLTADLAIFDRTIAVNLRGHLICTRALIPEFLRRGGGAMVYTSSDSAFTTGPGLCFYRISKAGLNGLVRQVAQRWGKDNIRANIVSPGLIINDGGAHILSPEARAAHLARQASPRLGEPDDVAAMVDFLLSSDASWITGQVMSVNGGFFMR